MLTTNADLLRLLPSAPAQLLYVTPLPDGDSAWWEAQGYAVQPLAWRVPGAFAQRPTSTRPGLYQPDFPVPPQQAPVHAAALVRDLSPQVHPLALFNQLDGWLASDAVVVLEGRHDDTVRMPRWLDYVLAIAQRCGYAVQAADEGAEDPAGDARFVRVLRKQSAPRWQLRHVRPADFSDIAALFQEVFGHALSHELWSWKYANGHGNSVLAARHGVAIAHYGGMYRDILIEGSPDWAFQICDVMVHPKERGVMTRQGPFLLTAATSAEIYGPLGFGFPNARAMLVAEKMGLYSEVGQLVSVRWDVSKSGYRWRSRARALNRDDRADQARVDAVWQSMARDLRDGVVGVRDWQYLEHRYFQHPHHHYEVVLVSARWTGRPLGVLVMRRQDDACELLDVVAPLAHMPLLVDQARRITGMWGLKSLYLWITRNQAQRFVDCEGKLEEINISIPTSCWTDDARANVFKDRWWLTSGDTDFR